MSWCVRSIKNEDKHKLLHPSHHMTHQFRDVSAGVLYYCHSGFLSPFVETHL